MVLMRDTHTDTHTRQTIPTHSRANRLPARRFVRCSPDQPPPTTESNQTAIENDMEDLLLLLEEFGLCVVRSSCYEFLESCATVAQVRTRLSSNTLGAHTIDGRTRTQSILRMSPDNDGRTSGNLVDTIIKRPPLSPGRRWTEI